MRAYKEFTVGGYFASGRPVGKAGFGSFENALEWAKNQARRVSSIASLSVWGWTGDVNDPNQLPDELTIVAGF